jgi:hypothetical protein
VEKRLFAGQEGRFRNERGIILLGGNGRKGVFLFAAALVLPACMSATAVSPTISPGNNTPSFTFTNSMQPSMTETPVSTETDTPGPTKTITSSKTSTRTEWISGDITSIASYHGNWPITRYEFFGGGTRVAKDKANAQIGLGMQ